MPDAIVIPVSTLVAAPRGVLETMATQFKRWWGNEISAINMLDRDMRIVVNDRVPPAWVNLFEALASQNWDMVNLALTELKQADPPDVPLTEASIHMTRDAVGYRTII